MTMQGTLARDCDEVGELKNRKFAFVWKWQWERGMCRVGDARFPQP